MTERELREAMRNVPVDDARARTLAVVRAAYAERGPAPRRRRWAPALAVAACVLVATVAGVGHDGEALHRHADADLYAAKAHLRS